MPADKVNSPPTTEEVPSFKRLARLLRPYSSRLILAVVMLIGLAGVNMLMPMFLGLLFNDVFKHEKWGLLWAILAGILCVYLIRNALYFGSKYTAVAVGEHVCFTLRNRLFERLQQMNLRFYRENNPGQISSRVMDDSFVVQSFIQEELPKLLQALCMFLFLVAIIYAVNWQLALASTFVLPLHLWAFYKFRGAIKTASRSAQEQISVVHGNLIEKFLGAEVVKGFTGEERENQAFVRAIETSRQSQLRSKKYHVTQKVVADLIVGLGTVGLLGFGAYQVMGPTQMQLGTFLSFFCFVGMLYPAVLDLVSGFGKMTKSFASIDRVFAMIESREGEASTQGSIKQRMRGHLRFRNVSFSYPEGAYVLRDISLDIPAGQVCAITGPSGAGKSTLGTLVPRFNEPQIGCVEIDGIDVRLYDTKTLRSGIGIAFQECFLFNSSIRENLQYARPDASMEEIVEVSRRTGAHDFISKLPQGYDTILGEAGVTLSRGEKQRITLTRAMLKNPQILILDEATASLDSASEKKVIPAIFDFMRGKTTLMITHRPELLKQADVLVYLENGRVLYQGRPEDLDIDATVEKGDGLVREEDRKPDRFGSGVWQSVKMLACAAVLGGVCSLRAAPALAADPPAADPPPDAAAAAQPEAPAQPPAEPTAQAVPGEASMAPTTAGRFIPMVGLTRYEVEDLVEVIVSRMEAQLGYASTNRAVPTSLMPPAAQTEGLRVLARNAGDSTRLLRIGYKTFRSQPIHVVMYGITTEGDGRPVPNPDLARMEEFLLEAQQTSEAHDANLTAADLATQTINLSYVESDRALALLKTFGYQTIEYTNKGQTLGKMSIIEPAQPVDPKNLPIIIAMPATDSADLVGGTGNTGGAFNLSMTPSVASQLPNTTSAAPMMQLMVLYHPAHPEQYSKIYDRVRTAIDLPARQILIEAMVLEISKTGLDKLGIEWELEAPQTRITTPTIAGRLPSFNTRADEEPTLEISFRDIFGTFNAKIESLIRVGEAEILSRPSVLTLDNRQASLRVGEDIPVATAVAGLTSGDKISFNFQYLPVGILLNVRPRVSAEGEEVSIQIDGVVSAEVPGQDLVLFDSDGTELARAPRISTRRVQTYGRIRNNTPFIIGGLVSKVETETVDKVPLLGDIPILGHLFRNTTRSDLKREVIIVITPFVLPEGRVASRTLPKDDDAFDSFNNELFRSAYRIRAEDVFDLRFLTNNQQLKRMRVIANQVVAQAATLRDEYPWREFIDSHFPGEHILVYRQMYEVIKRRKIEDQVNDTNLIFFKEDDSKQEGFAVRFLWSYMANGDRDTDYTDPEVRAKAFDAMEGKVLAMTYTLQDKSRDSMSVLKQPVPEVRYLDCKSSSEWSNLLWQLNQPDEEGRQRYTILIRDEDDLTRLKRAIVLKHTVDLNATRDTLTLEHFSLGRQILMPAVLPEKVYLVDEQAARYFFLTEQYYPAVRREIDRDIEALRQELQKPQIRQYLIGVPALENTTDVLEGDRVMP